MEKRKIIVVDDNEALLKSLRVILSREFTTVVTVSNPSLLPALLAKNDTDIVLLDMNFVSGKQSGEEGMFWLNYIVKKENPPAVLLMTAYAGIDLAIAALKQGAADFIIKPWDNHKLIETLINTWTKREQVKNTGCKEEELTARLLMGYYVKKYAGIFGKPTPSLSTNAELLLLTLFEEGEIELLEETIEQALLLHDKGILTELDIHIDNSRKKGQRNILTLEEMERIFIREVLKEKKGNLSLTAEQLNISRQTLYNKMKKYNL